MVSSPPTVESEAVTRGQTPATDDAEGDEAHIDGAAAEEQLPEKVSISMGVAMVHGGTRSSSISACASESTTRRGRE